MAHLVTILGGAGFIGRYVVEELARAGVRVRVASRHPQRARHLLPLGGVGQIQLLGADLRDARALAAAMAGAGAAINLVGILAEGGGRSFAAMHAQGAGAAARAAAGAGAQGFVQVSAIGADAASLSAYGRSKAAGEVAVRAAFPSATILRPSLVLGPEDAFTNRFAAMARLAPAMPVVAGDTRFQPAWVVDVARAIVAAVQDPGRHGGQTYELGGPRVATFREWIEWILRETRRPRPLIAVPGGLARLMAAMGDIVPGAPMTSDQYAMLQRDNVVAPGALGFAALGIAPTSVEAVAPAWLERYRPAGRFHRGAASG